MKPRRGESAGGLVGRRGGVGQVVSRSVCVWHMLSIGSHLAVAAHQMEN